MQPLVITIMGKDKPGLVDSLARCVYQHGGNWQGSSFAHMAGMFTGFVEVHVPADAHKALVDALDSLDGLSVQYVSVTDSSAQSGNYFDVEIMGNDKPGIVQELTSILNQFNLNILNFDSRCESAPNWGSLMFKAHARIAVPDNFDEGALKDALEAQANDVVVDISVVQA